MTFCVLILKLFENQSRIQSHICTALLWRGCPLGGGPWHRHRLQRDGCFGPGDPITRQQMAVMLYRFARALGMDTVQSGADARGFDDFEQVSAYAEEAIAWAANAAILRGADNRLMPQAPCTRAQMVTMLNRLLGE